MEKIRWTDELNTGVNIIDEQHKEMVSMINSLISDSEASVASETVSDVLTKMTTYAMEHFKTEETLMRDNAYPEYEAHKAIHKEFRLKTVGLCSATDCRVEDVPKNMFEYLYDWLRNHITKEDMKYKSFMAERGIT